MPHQARKRFGQNFLIDQNIIDKIILAIQPQAIDNLVEIGPGHGALTKPLLQKVDNLKVIEIDRDLCAALPDTEKLTVYCDDVLDFDLNKITKRKTLRIIGNLPYNISTPLLFHLFKYTDQIVDMHFMLQKEVVDRLVATPNNKSYGRLSVMAQYYANISKLFEVKPGSFQPAPKVTSAVVRLKPHPSRQLSIVHEQNLSDLVKLSFSHRRKTLRNNLKSVLNDDQIVACGIDPSIRAESLTLQEFIRLQNQTFT